MLVLALCFFSTFACLRILKLVFLSGGLLQSYCYWGDPSSLMGQAQAVKLDLCPLRRAGPCSSREGDPGHGLIFCEVGRTICSRALQGTARSGGAIGEWAS